jgi:N-methylhydantoinase A/oxoprolinase/acetone carboxylase beta subunit
MRTTSVRGAPAITAGGRARGSLGAGARLDGPAIVVEATATTVVEPGWQAVVTGIGD